MALFNYLNFKPDPDLIEMTKEGGAAAGFFLEPVIPSSKIDSDFNSLPYQINVKVINPRNEILPYGIFLWAQQYPKLVPLFQQASVKLNLGTAKVILDQGVFFRMNLAPGENILNIQFNS